VNDLPGWVVDAGWVAAHRDHVVLADVRWYLDGRSGRAAYEAGHLPGAVFVDLDTDLSAPQKGGLDGRHPLPTPEAFAASMGSLGISPGVPVVAYDDSAGGTAGRLVVMLRMLGRKAALLDGGLAAWTGPLEAGPGPHVTPVDVPAVAWPDDVLVGADEVAEAVATGAAVLDARAPERYRGDTEPVDPKAGHVPGARNAPWSGVLGADGRLRSAHELRAHFAALGAADGAIVYCGSGVSACADLVAMEHAGITGGRLFVGSWSAWSSDDRRPVAVGSEP